MKENYIKLYGTGSLGINVWEAWSEGSVVHIHANGHIYTSQVWINQSGRTMAEQVSLEVTARARKKLNQGFKRRKEELGKIITNQLGLAAPMLAQRLDRMGRVNLKGSLVQRKYNGHRFLVANECAYSKLGTIVETVPEITSSIKVPEEAIIDGELYHHGTHLQTIASWVKRRQANTLKLKYIIYDIIIPGMSTLERLKVLKSLEYDKDRVMVSPAYMYDEKIGAENYCLRFRKEGFEGAIIRLPNAKYEAGKRSKSLIKVKMQYDDEYLCVDVEPSADGWGILILKTPEGKFFRTSAPGNHQQKREALVNKQKYIGKFVTCEYAELTKDLIPFHCVAIGWRKDI